MYKPNGCIERKPTAQSVLLGGKYINLSAIARSQGIDHSYLSRILSGQRKCSVEHARKISAAVGMGLEQFLDALDVRRSELTAKHQAMESQYAARVNAETQNDINRIQHGLPPIPRMPGMRLKTA